MVEHGYVPLSARMDNRAAVDAAIEQMRIEMLEAAQRCAALIQDITEPDDVDERTGDGTSTRQ